MKTPYLSLTEECIRKKDQLADNEHNQVVSDYFCLYGESIPYDCEKEMKDVKRVLAVKKNCGCISNL